MPKKILLPFLLILACFIFTTPSFAASYVASVEGKSYTSFQKAVDSMKSGQTLTVLDEIITKDTVVIKAGKKKISINFAGNKYTYNSSGSAFDVKSGDVSVRGMNIISKEKTFRIRKKAALLLDNGSSIGQIVNEGNLCIKGGKYITKYADQENGQVLIENYNELTIDGGKFKVNTGNIIDTKGGEVVINNGTFKSASKFFGADEECYPAIYNTKKSSLTINDGGFSGVVISLYNSGKCIIKGGSFCSSGETPSVINSGEMTVYNGTFTHKDKNYYSIKNENGKLIIEDGSFVQGLSNYSKGNNYTKINGGTFRAKKKYNSVGNYHGLMIITGGDFYTQKNNAVRNIKGHIKISGGYFKSTNGYYALWNKDKATLTGGTFVTTGGNGKDIGCESGATIKVSSNVEGQVAYKN